ncbi:MAG TPA: sirohydrochlorin cobaltochelatase, partial [Negativicutes bacterium]
ARQSCIEGVENKIRKNFPDYEVRRAFTSKIVMKRLAENDKLYIDSLEQALDKLKKEGFKEVIVQTTHLTPGEEYDKKVVAVVEQYAKTKVFDKITIGRPVLFFQGENGTPDDFAILVKALESQIPIMQISGRYVVFMGHGSPHQPNPAYQKLQEKFNAAGLNVLVGVVEESDHPNFEDIKALLLEKNAQKITLMPLMLVAGDHANNDMAGAEPDSWKNQLAAEGFQMETYIHGLGENAAVQDIYVQHVRDAIHGSYK